MYYDKLIKIIRYIFLLFLVGSFTVSCKQSEIISDQSFIQDGKYDSGRNGKSLASSIKSISESVRKLDILTFYKTWEFPKDSSYTKDFISKTSPKAIAISSSINNESGSGTAFVVYYHNYLAGFLSCAHVVDYPDTVYTFYDEDQTIVRSMSVIIRQQIFISDLPSGSSVEVIAIDIEKDLAFLKKELDPFDENLKPLDFPVGSTDKLEWGSEIYVLGYPLGKLMLTKGIISIDKSLNKRFLSDALYNRGISGSPVFAELDGNNNFEWIGIASSASAQTVQYLTPKRDIDENVHNETAYYGDVFIEDKLLINYGVTYSIPIEEIITFIARNKSTLKEIGFRTDLLPTKD